MIQSVDDLDLKAKRVLVRVDFNEPLDNRGSVQDDYRMRATLPLIELLRAKKAKQIVLISHLGSPVVRPGEKLERTIAGNKLLRIEPIAKHLAFLLGGEAGDVAEEELTSSPLPAYRIAKDLVLLENLRFMSGERDNDSRFAKQLATLGDVFVNEAFSESHREVASLVALAQYLPHAAGPRLLKELATLSQLTEQPPKATFLVLGGAKVADKAPMIETLLKKVQGILLGGVMANTFLAAQGADLKKSLVEHKQFELAKTLLGRAPQKFILPIDFVWDRDRAVDIGPQTAALFAKQIAKAELVFWNGPMGWTASGRERFYRGSQAVAQAMATADATTIVAGGDTLEVVNEYEFADKLSFCSTGGGAALAYIAGQPMPGIGALEN